MLSESTTYERIVSLALAHTVNGVVITDATQAHNPIVHVNAGFTRLTGYEACEVIGRNCNFLQGRERDQPEVAHLRAAIAAGQSLTVVIRNFRKDGTPFWNQVELSPVRDEDTGRVTHFFALQTDVTLRRQTERANALRAIELERMFRGGPLGMVMVDEDGCVGLVTPALWRLLGLPAQPVQGLGLEAFSRRLESALQQSRTLEQPAAAAVPAAATAAIGDGASLAWPRAGEHTRWELEGPVPRSLDVSAFELGSLTRERIYVVRDITQEEAEQTTRSQFLAAAAHELRTPLGSISGFTELLLMRSYQPEQARPLLETILRQSMRLSALLNDLLDLSQMDTLGSQAFANSRVSLSGVIHTAVQVARPPGSDRQIVLDLPEADVCVQGHSGKLEQVLINLLSNAIKYSPDGGEVTLRVNVDQPSSTAHLSVTDRGLGLSDAHQARLFTRFFRADPGGPIPGTGLGLVIVKELVERMGGRISVQSRLGAGSTFTVSLQLCGASS